MALKTVDLTQQPHRAIFTGCTQEEVNYATTFWQSLQLLPPMESRLVSSDIKQRLRKAPPSRSMSECQNLDFPPIQLEQSVSVSPSNSGNFLSDPNSKESQYHFWLKPKTDSLLTQTSLIVNFGDESCRSGVTEISEYYSTGPHDIEWNDKEPSTTKISMSGSGMPASRKQRSGNMLGAGGREFWSRWPGFKGEDPENQLTRTIIPFSGEDLCRGKGFMNWGEKKFLSTVTTDTDFVEFSGEDLRGQRITQNPTSTVRKTLGAAKPQPQKIFIKKERLPPLPIKAHPHKISTHAQLKKKQRLVGTREQAPTFFETNNIPPENFQSLIQPSNFVQQLLQPVLRVLPESFTKNILSFGRDCSVSKTPSPKEEQNRILLVQKGRQKDSKNRTVSVIGKEPGQKSEQPLQGQPEKALVNTDGQSGDKIGVCHRADPPAVLTRPSKDLVYWTF